MKDAEYLNGLLSNIDSIIFDLGGVVVNIDYMKTQHMFESIGLHCFRDVYTQAAQSGLFDLYEKGLISTTIFRERLRLLAPGFNITDSELDAAWNAMILDLPSYRLDVLRDLKARYRTFLLSNTNELHIQHLHGLLMKQYGMENLNGYFEKVYYSYELHLRKPDSEIFEYVMQHNDIAAHRTLFIDDTIRHVEAAQSLGIRTLHIGSDIMPDNLYALLKNTLRAS